MLRRIIIMLLILSLLGFGFYKLGYSKLQSIKGKKFVEFSQKMSKFEEKKEQVLNFEKIKLKHKKLLEKLQQKNDKNFLQANEINQFIIYLNEFDVIKNVDFNSNPQTDLEVNFIVEGKFKDIYDFLTKIDYIYNTKQLKIKKAEQKIVADITFVFPIGGSD